MSPVTPLNASLSPTTWDSCASDGGPEEVKTAETTRGEMATVTLESGSQGGRASGAWKWGQAGKKGAVASRSCSYMFKCHMRAQ